METAVTVVEVNEQGAVMEESMMQKGTEIVNETSVVEAVVAEVVEESTVRVIVASKDMAFNYFSIDATHEELSVVQFMNRLDVFKFNDPIQRNCVWSVEKKSLLIVSILEEVSIGEIKTEIIRHNKKKFRNVLDGKQRLTTIRDYVRNRFALKNAFVRCYDENDEEVMLDISGMLFEELPKTFQDRITALIIDLKNYEGLDEKMKTELFQRWNNGEALKPSQLRKAKMSYELLFSIAEIKQLEVCEAGFSTSAVNNDMNSDMLLKALAVLKTDSETSLDSKTINNYLDGNLFTSEDVEELKTITNYLNDAYQLLDEKVAKKSFGASKTVTLIYVGREAVSNNVSPEDFAKWIELLFVTDYKKSGYATSSGTTKLESVKKRNRIGFEHFYNHFTK